MTFVNHPAALAGALPSIVGTTGRDRLRGTDGADTFDVSQGGHDRVVGGRGNDIFYFGNAFDAKDRVVGGAGDDTIVLRGSYGDPLVFGQGNLISTESMLLLGGGTFRLALTDVYELSGDELTVAPYESVRNSSFEIDGSAIEQVSLNFTGGLGDDVMLGGGADDSIVGAGGNDVIDGGDGDDFVRGNYGFNARGRDHVVLFGGGGDDSVYSYYGEGRAVLSGDIGNDRLVGGSDCRDTFYFEDLGGEDAVEDFRIGSDTFLINSSVANNFSDLTLTQDVDGSVRVAWGAGTSIRVTLDSPYVVPSLFLTADDFRFGPSIEIESARAKLESIARFGDDTAAHIIMGSARFEPVHYELLGMLA